MRVLGLFVMLTALSAYVEAQNCEPYASFPNHTMCIYKEAACSVGNRILKRLLTTTQQQEIVDLHNKLRNMLVLGTVPNQPKAKAMSTITWDPELAEIAQRLADQCFYGHDKMRQVARFKVGQNIHRSFSNSPTFAANLTPNMTATAMAWWNEVSSPGFNPADINPFKFNITNGHYTQMAWANTTKLGCGYTMYTNNITAYKVIVCNYGIAGNWNGQAMYIKA